MSEGGYSEPPSNQQALPIGATIGDQRITGFLGEGAFAFTYLAENRLGQQLAIKEFFPQRLVSRQPDGSVLPRSAETNAQFIALRDKFLDEAKLIAGISHPNIVQVNGFINERNTSYFTMPYLHGESLDKRAERGELLTPPESYHLVDQLIGALNYIHDRSIYHRDIKPGNIFVTRPENRPFLIDFGAAKITQSEGTERHTQIGTEHYRALEQITDEGNVGPWTDIYGLSATLYRLISGQFPADATVRMGKLVEGLPDPLLPLHERADLVQAFGEAFLKGIHYGLNLRRLDRPQTVEAWREALSTGEGIGVAPFNANTDSSGANIGQDWTSSSQPPPQGTTLKPEKSNTGRYMLAGLALLLLIGTGGFLAYRTMTSGPDTGEGTVVANDQTDPGTSAGEDDNQIPPATPASGDEGNAFQDALFSGDPQQMRDFLETYPDSDFAPRIQEELDKLEAEAWSRAQSRNTRTSYQSYLNDFPEGPNAPTARSRIREIDNQAAAAEAAREEQQRREASDWAQAQSLDTVSGYEAYLAQHPNGANAFAARTRRDEIQRSASDDAAFAQAQAQNTKSSYESYISQFPNGRHAPAARQKITELTPKPGMVFSDCPDCPQMVILPSGSYQRGASSNDTAAKSNEKPAGTVTISQPFAMGMHEVTFDEWDACVAAGGCSTRPDDSGWGRGRRPVINVSFQDAQSYVQWLSSKTGETYRLPSEAEWEYAARAGETSPFLGGSPATLCAFANGADSSSPFNWRNNDCADTSPDKTTFVGSMTANRFKLTDMIGNVSEWTQDCNSLNYRDAPTDGSADESGSCRQRVTRGGSFFSGANDMRLSARQMQREQDTNNITGFRVVREFRP